jgi:hypothetical protein
MTPKWSNLRDEDYGITPDPLGIIVGLGIILSIVYMLADLQAVLISLGVFICLFIVKLFIPETHQ